MESRTGPSGASAATPATLSDLKYTTPGHTGGLMSHDTPEQLLTPENSRSETSSNNDNPLNDEKPPLRRTSSRLTRASLRKSTQPNDLGSEDNGDTPSFDDERHDDAAETLVNNVSDARKSQPSLLRHSMMVIDLSRLSESTINQDGIRAEDHPMAPDTPVSKSSQEPQWADVNTSLQRRTLRRRAEPALVKQESRNGEKRSTRKSTNKQEPMRRSSRLSLLGRTSHLLDLGKRSKDKDDRRSSLRPRKVIKPEEPAATASDVSSAKRKCISEGDAPPDSKTKESGEELVKPPKYKPKLWLTEGLYIGQEPTDAPPTQNRNKAARAARAARRNTGIIQQRKFLPLPMFTGARLLNNGRDFKLPFDIFSPLPSGQPKPDEWRKTNKNVFVGEAGGIWRANKRLELSKCLCIEETGCDENCQNRYMFYECDDGNCGLGRECGNRSFEELKQRTKAGGKYNIGVEVIKTPDRGYGVRSNRTFEPNQIIVEYTGEIITQTECERRMRTIYKNNECYYLMYFDQNMIIDATRGSIARFVNHSCEPNCRMEKWTVAGKPRMALFAGDRGIMTGEELSYDYNFDPYSQKNVQQCRCGSDNCRGVLGPRPKEKERTRESTSNTNAGAKRKNVRDASASRSYKRRKVLTPQSNKSGIRGTVTKARATVSRSTTTQRRGPVRKETKETKQTSRQITSRRPRTARGRPRTKANAKLPVVKPSATAGAKARASKAPMPGKTQARSSTKLTRPSAETKARLAKGSPAQRRLTKEKEHKATPVRKRNNQYTKGTAKRRASTAMSRKS